MKIFLAFFVRLWHYINMELIEKARIHSHAAHDAVGQTRKYTGERYWIHTDEVARLVSEHGGSENMIAAAFLHDEIEDLELTAQDLVLEFPTEVVKMVLELTDQFTSENFPEWNREKRKQAEAMRISGISPEAKTIKLADLLSNTRSIVDNDPGFARVYLREKARMMQGLIGGNPALYEKVNNQLKESLAKLDMTL